MSDTTMSNTEGESYIDSAIKEVVSFLAIDTPILAKGQILDYLLGMTGTQSGVSAITKNKELLTTLVNLFNASEEPILLRKESLKILVNITSTVPDGSAAVDANFDMIRETDTVNNLLSVVLDKTSKMADHATMLLTNTSRSEKNSKVILSAIKSSILSNEQYSMLFKLFEAFGCDKYNNECNLHHLGSFLANLTQLHEVRNFLIHDVKELFQRILPYTHYMESDVRRAAAVRIVRNCTFDSSCHEWLLSDEVDVLPTLLLPLAGPEDLDEEEMDKLPLDLQYLPDDKKRDPNKEVIILLIETLFQLCCTKPCRMLLKSSGAYYILRELFNSTEDKDIVVPLENLIQVLIGDEPDEDKENLREVDIPEDVKKRFDEIDAQEE